MKRAALEVLEGLEDQDFIGRHLLTFARSFCGTKTSHMS